MENRTKSLYARLVYEVMQTEIKEKMSNLAGDCTVSNDQIERIVLEASQKVALLFKQNAVTVMDCCTSHLGYDSLGEFVDAVIDSYLEEGGYSFDDWITIVGKIE